AHKRRPNSSGGPAARAAFVEASTHLAAALRSGARSPWPIASAILRPIRCQRISDCLRLSAGPMWSIDLPPAATTLEDIACECYAARSGRTPLRCSGPVFLKEADCCSALGRDWHSCDMLWRGAEVCFRANRTLNRHRRMTESDRYC